MTRKRFRFSLAVFAILAAFLAALFAFLLAPTLASADKMSGTAHRHMDESDFFHGDTSGTHHTGPVNGTGGWNAPNDHSGPCLKDWYLCIALDEPPGGADHEWTGSSTGAPPSQGGTTNPQGQSGHSDNHSDKDWGGYFGSFGPFGGVGFGGGLGQFGPNNPGPEKPQDCKEKAKDENTEPDDDADDATCDAADGTPTPLELFIADHPQTDDPQDSGSDENSDSAGAWSGGLVFDIVSPFGEGLPSDDVPKQTLVVEQTDVPEPLTISLFAAGLAGAATARRKAKPAP